jgi:outer membrane protein assembly factor BamB
MKRSIATTLMLAVCGALLMRVGAHAADWPQWRGPDRNGLSKETGLLKEWPASGPQLLWQIKDLGEGYSTPAISGERLYVQSNEGIEDEYVLAIDLKDQKKLWRTQIGKVGPNQGPQYPGARGTPTIDGELLYALGSDGDLACLETASGKVRWQKNVRSDFGGKCGNWAYAESTLVDGDRLVCTPGGVEATLVALDKKTGNVIWKAASPEGDQAGYASIIIAQIGGVKQYVQFLQKGLVGLDANTGKILWRYSKTAEGSSANIPTPIAIGDFVYSGANRTGGGLVKIKFESGAFEPDQIYFSAKLPTAIGGAVEADKFLYGTNTAGLMCADFASGETKWQDRCVGAGSVCVADGRIYVHGEKGDVALVELTPEGYHEKGRFTPPDQPDRGNKQAWAYPSVANGKLYLRDLSCLWCYDVKNPPQK